MKALLQLIHAKNKSLVYLILVGIILGTLLGFSSTVQNYRRLAESPISQKDFRLIKRSASDHDDPTWKYKTYAQYVDEQKWLYAPQTRERLMPTSQSAGDSLSVTTLISALIMGVLLAGMANSNGFNAVLFGSGASRRKIFWTRYFYGYIPVLVGNLIALGATLASYYTVVPAHYVGLTVINIAGLLLFNMVNLTFMYTAGIAIGTIFTNTLLATGFAVATTFLGSAAIPKLLRRFMPADILITNFNNRHFGIQVGLTLLVAAVVALISQWLFQRISLENSDAILVDPRMRWLVVAVSAVILPPSLGMWLLQNQLLSELVTVALVIGLGIWWGLSGVKRAPHWTVTKAK